MTAESPAPCPEPTSGSVTDPSGSVGKTPLTDLVDAYSQVSGVDWRHQPYSTLSNKQGVCVRIQTAHRSDQQPAPFAPGTYEVGVGARTSRACMR